ncbi:M23 family metallopeptidase [Gephyromycinifex aptenodytis]|uniref:M23 family metallopeptidase n=1 Tax=Gephyromycinifex aptenodytis TaxID=2716227 RepID=UPI001448322C|nr:M23 family metallopeptidase [Gephyromycinifex aptenodytis]
MHSRTGQRSSRQRANPAPNAHPQGDNARSALTLGAAAVALGAVIGLGGGASLAFGTDTPTIASPARATSLAPPQPAAQVIGLVRTERPQRRAAKSSTTSVVDVVLTPAARNRLTLAARATRAEQRAALGAREGWARAVDDGTRISSGFGRRWGRLHAGVDLAGPIGTPVRAVAQGQVDFAGRQRGYGNVIMIKLEDGTTVVYGHLDKIRVTAGEQVTPGQLIAALGNTGRSTGPHLHFEVRTPEGEPTDPMPWLQARGIVPVPAKPTP